MKLPGGRIIRDITDIYTSCRIPRSAASLAYSLTLAVFPMLLCLGSLPGGELSAAHAGEWLAGIVPEPELGLLTGYLAGAADGNGTAFFAGALMLLTSSSAAFRSLENTMSDIYASHRKPSLPRLLLSFAYSALFFAGVYLSCAVIAGGEWLFVRIADAFELEAVTRVREFLRLPFMFVLLYFMIFGTYTVTTPPKTRCGTGAFLASSTLAAIGAAMSWGIGKTAKYELIYGSIASVIILMVWFYVCALVLITGSAVNAAVSGLFGKY